MGNPVLPLVAIVLSVLALLANWQANERVGVILEATAATKAAALPDAEASRACFELATGLDDEAHKALFAGRPFTPAAGEAPARLTRCDPKLARRKGGVSEAEAKALSREIQQHLGRYDDLARLFVTAGLPPPASVCTGFSGPAKAAAGFLRDAIRRDHDGARADTLTKTYANILAFETKSWCRT